MSRIYNVDILLNVLNQTRNPIATVVNSLGQLRRNAQQGSREFILLQRAIDSLNNPVGGYKFFEDFVDIIRNAQTGLNGLANTNIGQNIPAALRQLDIFTSRLRETLRVAEQTGNVTLFNEASDLLETSEKLTAQLKEQVKVNRDNTQELSRQKSILDAQTSEVSKSISKVRKDFESLKQIGSVFPSRDQFLSDLDTSIDKLEDIRKELIGLGKSTTSIDIKIAEAKNLRSTLNNVTELTDALARQKYEIKLDAGQKVKNITKELKELNKELQEAAEKRDLTLIANIKVKTDDLEKQVKKVREYGESTGDAEIIKSADKLTVSTNEFKRSLSKVDQSIPRGILGYFKNLGKTVQEAKTKLGGNNAALRSTAGALRLVGTSAFLVGGQFRTLGFGASALGNILQTFGPLLGQVSAAFGPLAPLVIAIGAALAGAVVQAAAFTVAIVSIIDVGFRFNNQFAKVQNSVSAVAREFFSFSSDIRPATEGLNDGAKAALEFEVAGSEVAKQLEALQLEATKTEFTAQDLFEAFQSTTSALGNLSPSLQASRELTGLFARTASIARVPISQLGSSISQIVAGTGRVTNPLVRDVFNKLKDSQGITLTAKRIRELRAQGGDVLFNELTAALKRFTDGVGELQSERTLSGAASNIQDLFQVFSGKATKEAFQTVIKSLVGVRDAIVSVSKDTGAITFTKPFQQLLDVAKAFITRIGKDVSGLIDRALSFFSSLGEAISGNYEQFVAIYELIKDILGTIGSIITDFLEFVGLTSKGTAGFKVIQGILLFINSLLIKFRVKWNLIGIAILGVVRIVTFLGQGVGKIISALTGNTVLEDWANSVARTLDDKIASRFESIGDAAEGFIDSVKKVTRTDEFRQDLVQEGQKVAETITATPQGNTGKAEEGRASSQRSNLKLLEQYKQFYNSLIELSQQTNEALLQQAQQRIQREQELIALQTSLGLKGEIAAQNEITALRLTSIQNEITAREAALKRFSQQDRANALFTAQTRDTITRSRKNEQEEADSTNKIEEEGIQLITEKIRVFGEERKINQEIQELERQKAQIQLEDLQARAQSIVALRRDSAELAASIAEIQYPNSFAALTEKFSLDIINAAEAYTKINSEILTLSSNSAKLSSEEKIRLDNLKKYNDRLVTQLALRQQQATFDQLQFIAGRELESLSRDQALIQREVELGRLSSEAGQQKIIQLNYDYARALEVVLVKLKQVSGENPTLEQQRQIFDLEQRLVSLRDTLTESTLLNATNSLRENLVDTFVSIQENAGSAVDAIKGFANSVLSTFRRLLAERVVRDLFKTLFPEPGQTSGRAGGLIASFLRSLGLSPEANIQAAANQAPVNQELVQRVETEVSQAGTFSTLAERESSIRDRIVKQSQVLVDTFKGVTDKISEILTNLGTLPQKITLEDFNTNFKSAAEQFKKDFIDASKAISAEIKARVSEYINDILGIKLIKTDSGAGAVSGAGAGGGAVSGSGARLGGAARSRVSGGTGDGSRRGGGASASGQGTAAGGAGAVNPKVFPIVTTSAPSTGILQQTDAEIGAGGRKPTSGGVPYVPAIGSTPYGAPAIGVMPFIDRYFNRNKDATRKDLINKILYSSPILSKILPESVFSNISTEELPKFNLRAPENARQYAEALEARLVQAYSEYTNKTKMMAGSNITMSLKGYIKDSQGNFTTAPIYPARRVYGNDVVARAPNDPRLSANVFSQVINDIGFLSNKSKELIDLNNKIIAAESSLDANVKKLNSSAINPEDRPAIEDDIQARKTIILDLKNKAAALTTEINVSNNRLKTLNYNPNTSADIYFGSNTPFAFYKKYATGGAVFGKGGPTEDSIPAMLSNGEYVVNAKSVSKLGVPFFNRLNNINSYADGGKLIDTLYSNPAYRAPSIDASKFNYFGGAASLINRPAAIVEAAAKKVDPQKRKKRGIFGSILSFIAPFLSAIPVVGPLLSLGVGAAGGALSGSEKGVLGGILGGIFGGLSNLGGFSGSKGFMGNLSKFFGEGGKGAPFLSLLGMSGAGNLGNTLGQGLFGLSSQIFSKTPTNMINMFDRNSARDIISSGVNRGIGYDPSKIGNILSKVGLKGFKFAGGGFLGNLSPILGGLFGGSGGPLGFLSPLLGGSKGGGANLLGMFAPILMSMLGVGGGMFGMLIPLLMSLFGSKGSGKNLGLPATGAIAMATGGIVPAGPTPNPLTSAISSLIASSGNIPNTKRRGLVGNIGTLMSSAVKLSESLSSVKLPTIDKILTKQGFGVLATKGGWKIGLGKALKFANGGTVNFPFGKNLTMSQIFPKSGSKGGSSTGSLLNLGLALGSMFLPSLLNRQPKQPDYSITDPDYARKNRFGSAYDSLVEYGVIGEYRYQKETLEALRRGSKWMPIQRQRGNAGSLLNMILPFVFSSASGLLPKKKARGGMITGPGTGTSDSIPAWLSSGEYVIKASAVRSLGTDILDSINEGRFKFAKGGLAGDGVNTLPEIDFSAQNSSENPVTVNSNTKIVNVLDPSLVGDYLQTNEGTKVLVNLISRRSREIKAIINR